MTDMVERVARVLAPQAWCIGYHPQEREWSLAKARAAIEAMREPSHEMIVAGEMCDAEAVWTVMIDASLAGEDEPK